MKDKAIPFKSETLTEVLCPVIDSKYEYDFAFLEGRKGFKATFKFENGYGASVVDHDWSYGLEVAVLDSDGEITYTTPITDNIIPHCTTQNVRDVLKEISELT